MQKDKLISSTGQKLAILTKMPETKPDYILIACHGFFGGKENGGWINLLAEKLAILNIGLLAFDFEGCGESEGEFAQITLTRQADNLKDVMAYVKKEYDLPMILLGRSFGGSTILAGGSDWDEVIGYILWATPIFLGETFSAIMPNKYEKMSQGQGITMVENNRKITIAPDFALDLNQHNMDKYLLNLKNRPLLVIHGTEDMVVNLANAEYIEEKLPHAKVHVVEGANHSFAGYEKERIDLTIDWLSKIFN